MPAKPQPEIPVVVVGCDFRQAPVVFREALVTTVEQRAALFRGINSVEPGAGLVVLETCNRIEWIVTCDNLQWMGELLTAQMLERWRQAQPDGAALPQPRVYLGREGARHLLRVVAGLESLAAGEAQIAGQFQAALSRAREENTISTVINGLAKHAGRLAKTALKLGYRSDHRRGIHGMAADYLKRHFGGTVAEHTVAVVGMGSIGRKTAENIEHYLGAAVLRVNRTVDEAHHGSWRPLAEVPECLAAADAAVVATGALSPVLLPEHCALLRADHPLLLLDIGIPRQVAPDVSGLPVVVYRNLDDLIEIRDSNGDQQVAQQLEQEIEKELDLFKRFCIERNIVTLFEETQRRRQEFFFEQIPALVNTALANLDEDTRRQVESAMKQLISDYSYYSFNSIHHALEKYWSDE